MFFVVVIVVVVVVVVIFNFIKIIIIFFNNKHINTHLIIINIVHIMEHLNFIIFYNHSLETTKERARERERE